MLHPQAKPLPMRCTAIVALCMFVSFSGICQRTIAGEIRERDGAGMPGVNILEKGTNNGVTSDGNGRFSIDTHGYGPILVFSFIGYETVEFAPAKDTLLVYMEADTGLYHYNAWYGYPRYTSLGYNGGLIHTPAGVRVENALPALFGLKMWTTTTLAYRTDFHDNNFIDIRIHRDELVYVGHGSYFDLELGYNRRRISDDTQMWNTTELNIIPEFNWRHYLKVRLGYGRQSFNDIETLKSNQGFIFGLGSHQHGFTLQATAKKWNTYWQTEIDLSKYFWNGIEVGARFESVESYREVDLFLVYVFQY